MTPTIMLLSKDKEILITICKQRTEDADDEGNCYLRCLLMTMSNKKSPFHIKVEDLKSFICDRIDAGFTLVEG